MKLFGVMPCLVELDKSDRNETRNYYSNALRDLSEVYQGSVVVHLGRDM